MRKASDQTVKAYELWTKSLGGTREIVAQARYREAVALGELGRFEEAVPSMDAIAKETLEKEWPADAKP